MRAIGPAHVKFGKNNNEQVDRPIEFGKATCGIAPRGGEWMRDLPCEPDRQTQEGGQ